MTGESEHAGSDSSQPRRHYRLQGAPGSACPGTFPLHPGANRIGSARSNDVVVPLRGVSREHAVLHVGEEGVTVEDLASKNGTSVSGRPVARAAVSPGEEIGLGPVRLSLEEVAAGDLELGLQVDPAAPPGSGGLSRGSTADLGGLSAAASRPWLGIVESFVERLAVRPAEDLEGALRTVVRGTGATAACLAEWAPRGEPVVLAAAGRVGHLPEREVLAEAAAAGSGTGAAPPVGGEGPVWAALPAGAGELLGLFVWGRPRDPTIVAELLRVLLRLTLHLRQQPVEALDPDAAGPADSATGLCFPSGYVVGESPAMVSLYRQMESLADGDLPVLLAGETGVGKELLARILHDSSPRSEGPYVAVNCAAIPGDLLEAELFGIGAGVATGVHERQGKFVEADGGSLLLDEIGELPQPLQAKLLRALQEKEVQPLGRRPRPVDVRIVAASNRDLRRAVADGDFRGDLYYRIAGYVLEVPPLRERREDLPRLIGHFLRRASHEAGRSVRGVTVKALEALSAYPWPGNVRELEHEVRRLAHLCPDGQAVDSLMLSPNVSDPVPPAEGPGGPGPGSLDLTAHTEVLERRLIRRALARTRGNQTRAAKLLGISRNGLAKRLKRLGIEPV